MSNFAKEFFYAAGLRSVPSVIATISAALSVIQLAKYGWHFGIAAPIQAIFDIYNELLSVIFEILRPLINIAIQALSSLFQLQIDPAEHWQHLFMLTMILLVRVSTYFYGVEKNSTSAFVTCDAVIVAFLGSLAAGSIPLDSTNYTYSVLVGTIPIISILIFYVLQDSWRATFERLGPDAPEHHRDKTWIEYFMYQFRVRLLQAVVGVVATMIVFTSEYMRIVLVSGLLVIPLYIAGCAIHAFFLGARDASARRKSGESWGEAFWRMGNARIGAAVVGVYLWCVILLVSNAGLRSFGL